MKQPLIKLLSVNAVLSLNAQVVCLLGKFPEDDNKRLKTHKQSESDSSAELLFLSCLIISDEEANISTVMILCDCQDKMMPQFSLTRPLSEGHNK